jgi:hypothetical protein
MSRARTTNELLDELFEHQPHSLRSTFMQWLGASKRFKLFVETNRTKIKAKIKALPDAESQQDLAFEFAIAYWLHQDARLAVAYEQPVAGQTRRPDFAVTFTTKFTFSVEVTRIRPTPDDASATAADDDPARANVKLQYVIANKLAQMLPGMINLLVIGAEGKLVQHSDLNAVMLQLKKRAEAKDAQLFSRSGSRDTADFFRAYHRVSGILLRTTPSSTQPAQLNLWANKEAKHSLPANLQTLLTSMV